jgi:DNA modification methylase
MPVLAHTRHTQTEFQFPLETIHSIHSDKQDKEHNSVINADMINTHLGILIPGAFPARHNLHKYWGKKPANIFSKCISFFSKEGELVLDPFCGSGVTVIESVISKRKAIGLDLNPFAAFLTETLLQGNKCEGIDAAMSNILAKLTPELSGIYGTNCASCGTEVIAISFGWKKTDLISVRYYCSTCKKRMEHLPTEEDLRKAVQRHDVACPDMEMHYGWEMQKLKRGNIKKFSELFTSRNLLLLSHLWDLIVHIENDVCRHFLQLTFTANLAQASKMIADNKDNGGGPSWKINCYWLPADWQELNVLHYFQNRLRRTKSAVLELGGLLPKDASACGSAVIHDSRKRFDALEDNSVDYILTDPPYGGEGIQYGELSMLWNLWLGYREDLDAEVAFNPYRNKAEADYADGLKQVFAEAFRVLKPGRWMSVTFNNKDIKVWNSLISACKGNGFELVVVAPIRRSAPSLTESVMTKAPKSDVLIHFRKPDGTPSPQTFLEKTFSVFGETVRLADEIIQKKGFAQSSEILDALTVEWFTFQYSVENGRTDGELTLHTVNNVLTQSPQFRSLHTILKQVDEKLWSKSKSEI